METALLLLSLVMAQVEATPGPKLTAPAQIQAQPGKHFQVKLDTNCKWLKWVLPPGLERVPVEMAGSDKVWIGYGPAGVYEFTILGSLNDVHTECKCVVFVGQPQPGPAPVPPQPVPNDPLFAEIQRLYAADANPQKATFRDTLASIYTTAADAAINDASVTTTGQLFAKLRSVSKLMLKNDQLRTVRDALKAICKDLENDVPLDGPAKAKAAACFDRCAKILQGLK